MLLAEIGLGDVLWSMIAFFFFVIFLWIIFGIIGDVFRSKDLSGLAKALWCIAIVLVPWLTIFVYLITRGSGMSDRAIAANQKAQAQFDSYVRETAGTASPTDQITQAKALLDAGTINQDEFDHLKAKALGRA